MLKSLYLNMLRLLESLYNKIILIKTTIAEDFAIFTKRKLYKSIKWSKEQKDEFNTYWKKIYGKKIPSKWHRLYEASSGKYCINYIPEKLYTTKIEPKLNDRKYSDCFEDKSLIEIYSKNCGCVVPKTIIGCAGGNFFDENRLPISKNKALEILKNENDMVIKPSIGSSSGKGILFFDTLKDKSIEEISGIFNTLGKDFIVQKKIIQHPVFSKLNESSINTIRLTTFIIDGKIHHIPIFLRIGRKGKNVDNVHAGGLCIGVSDSGELYDEAFLLGYGNNSKRYTVHPDSNIVFSGYKLPNIKEIIESAYKVHCNLPHTNIVSWDFSVDVEGNPVLIEANIMGQGIWASQMIFGKGPFGEYTDAVISQIR